MQPYLKCVWKIVNEMGLFSDGQINKHPDPEVALNSIDTRIKAGTNWCTFCSRHLKCIFLNANRCILIEIGRKLTSHNLNSLQWRQNGDDSVSNHQPHDCFLNLLFRRRSNKTSKLRVTGLCAENSPGTGEFPAQMASNAESGSIWWRHHVNDATVMFLLMALQWSAPDS